MVASRRIGKVTIQAPSDASSSESGEASSRGDIFLEEEQNLQGFNDSSVTASEAPFTPSVGYTPSATHVLTLSDVDDINSAMEVKIGCADEIVPGRRSFNGMRPILTDESLTYSFRSDKPILTRHSSATRSGDGSFVIDDSVPDSIREALRAIEMESRSPKNVEKRWSVNRRPSGDLNILGSAAQATRYSVHQHADVEATKVDETANCCFPR